MKGRGGDSGVGVEGRCVCVCVIGGGVEGDNCLETVQK